MWFKNVAFLGICGLGLIAVGSRLYQPEPRERTSRDAVRGQAEAERVQELVGRVDGEFQRDWQTRELAPTGRADTSQIMRRLSLSLTGTIPSLEELRRAEQIDPDARVAWWLEHLLGERRCSDYLAERFARAWVGTENGPFLVYRRRRFVTWLSDQLRQNRPYDELVTQLITARGLWTDAPEVNFLTVTADANDGNQPDPERLAARTVRAFLGVRLDCVQCHDDHLGGPWLQQDFQCLAAYYAEVKSTPLGIINEPTEYVYQFLGEPESEIVTPSPPFARELAESQASTREQLAAWVTHPDNRSFARATVNRVWAILFGRPLVEPIDRIPLEGPFPPGLETLAEDFVNQGYDLRRLIRAIALTQTFQLRSDDGEGVTPSQEEHWAAFPLTRLRPDQVAGALLQASSLTTIDSNSHILVRLAKHEQQRDFVTRYGDRGEDEFGTTSGTIPQRLLMMNGKLVHERTKDDLVANAATRIAAISSTPRKAVENTFLAILTRLPSDSEHEYFLPRFSASEQPNHQVLIADLYWVLFNCTEFSWNH